MSHDHPPHLHRGPSFLTGFVTGILAVVAVAGAIGLYVVYAGAFNVAATEEHSSFTRWAFGTTLHNSVERRADGLIPPDDLGPQALETGATEYKEYCAHCHAGPGVERAGWAGGMRPRPPHLTEAAAHWDTAEVFWLVKHGVKMSGMPAFGPGHDDRTLWSIAAFVKRLPAMTPEEYAAIGGEGHHHGEEEERPSADAGGHGH